MTRQSVAALVLAAVIGVAVVITGFSRSAARRAAASARVAGAATEGRGAAQASQALTSPTERAIDRARKEGEYVFLLFYRPNDRGDAKMKGAFDRAQARLTEKAVFVSVDMASRAEARLIDKYDVRRAPLPLTLVMAPNGAIVRAFTQPVQEDALANAFASAKVAEVLKALQDRKLVTLCLQGPTTKHNSESLLATRQFVSDAKLAGQAVLVVADPQKEPDLLKRCGIAVEPADSTTVMLLPPGRLIAKISGATTKDVLLARLQSGLASCGSGCGPSGCGQ